MGQPTCVHTKVYSRKNPSQLCEDNSSLNSVLALGTLARAVGKLFNGVLLDHFGVRPFLFVVLLLASGACCALAVAQSIGAPDGWGGVGSGCVTTGVFGQSAEEIKTQRLPAAGKGAFGLRV